MAMKNGRIRFNQHLLGASVCQAFLHTVAYLILPQVFLETDIVLPVLQTWEWNHREIFFFFFNPAAIHLPGKLAG